jgi:hypothetical protein
MFLKVIDATLIYNTGIGHFLTLCSIPDQDSCTSSFLTCTFDW